jgi:hypothetical protein
VQANEVIGELREQPLLVDQVQPLPQLEQMLPLRHNQRQQVVGLGAH